MQSQNSKLKMEFKIRNQNENFKIKLQNLDKPINFEFKFVISEVLPHFFLLSTWESTMLIVSLKDLRVFNFTIFPKMFKLKNIFQVAFVQYFKSNS